MKVLSLECHDCSDKAPLKTCARHNPKGAKICKDCCIGKMNGHRCPYFEMCWF